MAAWRWIDRGDEMDVLGRGVERHESDFPGSLPNLRGCSKLCALIDWGGQDRTAKFSSLAILLADEPGCESWYRLREQVRRNHLPDERRLSYKSLSDRVRQRALLPFLVAADEIPGLLFTILVDRDIPTLTEETDLPPKVDFAGAVFGRDDYWRLELTAQFLGFLLAGLSDPGQKGQLIVDEDNIVANPSQQTAVCTALSLAMKDRVPHQLGGWTVSSPALATDKLMVEDLLAVVDLAAGALADVASSGLSGTKVGFVPANPSVLKPKTVPIVTWLALGERSLKRLALIVRKDGENKGSVTAQFLGFEMSPPILGLI
jgi:hypothetical protein